MPIMRAKLTLSQVVKSEHSEQLTFNAVAKSNGYPPDGNDEDNTYAKWSPSAELKLTVANPELWGKLIPGQKFYVDFTVAETLKAVANA